MALPTTISGTKFPGANYYCGPFLSGGNVYVVTLDTTNSKIHVYKATDPTTSFTEQDSANVPAQTLANTANAVLWALQSGTLLYIAAGDGTTTPAYKFHQFSMATDTWSGTIKDKAILSPTLGAASSASISIVKRSDGSFVALLNGAKETLMGNPWDRVSYVTSTDGGATWSAETAVGAAGVKRNITGSVVVLGASDRSHFFYADASNSKHRSLSSVNALDTEQAVVTSPNAGQHNFTPGIAYVSGANTVVKVGVDQLQSLAHGLASVLFTSGANPTLTTFAWISDASVTFINNTNVACHTTDGTTAHAVFSDATTTDLMHDKQADGGSWGTDVNEWAATINRVSANVYTRSGSIVLAVLVDDGGTVKYNELMTAPLPDTIHAAVVASPSFVWWDQSRRY